MPLVAGSAAVGLAVLDPFRLSWRLRNIVGIGPVLSGLGLVGWTAATVRGAGETLSPVTQPDRLVTTGPFAHTRNPMYLGVILTVAGVAMLARSPVVTGYTGLLWVTYHVIVVTVEEPKLRNECGAAYEAYCKSVPRWLPQYAAPE